MANHYSFGHININEKEYVSDIIIYPDGGIQDNWRRREGHQLGASDIEKLIDSRPDMIIAGTGAYGMMKASPKLEAELEKKGISFRALPSEEALRLYEETVSLKKVGLCIHLTC